MSLPELVQRFLTRTTSSGTRPEVVRVHQEGEMWRKPGSRGMRFTATEEFSVRQVAFSWRARFPVVGRSG